MVFRGAGSSGFHCCAFLFASARFQYWFVALLLIGRRDRVICGALLTPIDYNHAVVRGFGVALVPRLRIPACS